MVRLEEVTTQNAMILKSVRLQALQDMPKAFGSTYERELLLTDEEWMERAARWTVESSTAYLAFDGTAPCGIAAGVLDSADAARAHLLSMWVSPTHRRLGVGRLLVEAVSGWARSQDANTLLLMVTSSNDPAIRFYTRLGFNFTGRTEPYPNDPALIEYEMARIILHTGTN